ncbi:MAG: alpha/beta hydrolase family protein [Candidatus Brocadiia bacterium]
MPIRRAAFVSFASVALLSLAGGALGAAEQVAGLRAHHRAGQTFLVWDEVDPPVTAESIAAKELRARAREAEKTAKVRYRVYRSSRPIRSLDGLEPIAEVPPLTCWNADYYGIYPKPDQMAFRYVVREGQKPLPPGTGLYVHNPEEEGEATYAVTLARDGSEERSLGAGNVLERPVAETVGQGVPVLQRVEKPESFHYIKGPTLHYYVRWEAAPNCAEASRPYDYVVALPPKVAEPAPVGIHLHCWGGSLDGGYGWWYNAEKGALLLASNQVPYDWWTGYHELYWRGPRREETWRQGVVRPYTTTRLLSFLEWMGTQWPVDPSRTFVAGSSMGGSGAPMFAIRYPRRVAWAVSWVGVHIPSRSPQFKGSYARVYGEPAWGVKFEDGTPVWDYYNDARYLRQHPQAPVGLITFSNGKNDGGIGWPQAVDFFRSLQETRRPHIFVWGQAGHGQRARMPGTLGERVLPIDVRTDLSLPAFTRCSLDDDPGGGDPADGDPKGQANLYLVWETDDLVDRPDRWEITVGLAEKAPAAACTVDVTPRRLQRFEPEPGQTVRWQATALGADAPAQSGTATADRWGLVTLPQVRVVKGGTRVRIAR